MAKPKFSSPYSPEELLEVCLENLGKTGWKAFSFASLSHNTGIPLSAFYEHFQAPSDILIALFQKIDQTVLASLSSEDYQCPKDALFDVVMMRLDAASPYKPILQSFWVEWIFSPEDMPFLASQSLSSLRWMLEAAQLKTRGLSGLLRLQGLGILYLLTVRIWLKDTTPDLSPTMAFLDNGLSRLEKMAEFLRLIDD